MLYIVVLLSLAWGSRGSFDFHLADADLKGRGQLPPSSWIVHLEEHCDHETFESHANFVGMEIHTQYKHLLHAVVIKNQEYINMVALPCVKRVVRDSIKRITSFHDPLYSWGIDRLDQSDLPLNGAYSPSYTGLNVDVYVVDTGIDTTHQEFSNTETRQVSNIYNALAPSSSSTRHDPGINIDDIGHGTHVAATIGGQFIGVSPDVNLYGVKVLGADGSGTSTDIITALEYIVSRMASVEITSKRTVISMSLGGPCEDVNCAWDSLNMAVDALNTRHHIVVSVAAGNEGCNACNGSPAGAASAVRTGAIDQFDDVPFFSNFGQCVTVFAPGVNIMSACSSAVCGAGGEWYESKSGTSMAAPHTTGVLAQYLQQDPTASTAALVHALLCDAAKDRVHLHTLDSITPNVLLQIPVLSPTMSTCTLGEGCQEDCHGHGLCLNSYNNSVSVAGNPDDSTSLSCYCDEDHTGPECERLSWLSRSGGSDASRCPVDDYAVVSFEMVDTHGDGWNFARYSITSHSLTAIPEIADNAYNGLCFGKYRQDLYCLPDDVHDDEVYRLDVTFGNSPEELEWLLCGEHYGGAPFSGLFSLGSFDSSSHSENRHENTQHTSHCTLLCPFGNLTDVYLYDTYGDGWNGGYYAVFTADGRRKLAGGSLTDGFYRVHSTCLSVGEYVVLFELNGEDPSEMSIRIGDTTVKCGEMLRISVDSQHVVTVSEADNFNTMPYMSPTADNPEGLQIVPFYLFDSIHKDNANRLASTHVHVAHSSTVNDQDTFSTNVDVNFGMNVGLLLKDNACYDFDVTDNRYSSDDDALDTVITITDSNGHLVNISNGLSMFWSMCGTNGYVPFHSRLCIEKKFDLCYGMSGCAFIKSYAPSSSHIASYISPVSTVEYGEVVLQDRVPVHGVHELCAYADGCYDVFVGAGTLSFNHYNDSAHDVINHVDGYAIDEVHICGVIHKIPSTTHICLSKNSTVCEVRGVTHHHCKRDDEYLHSLVKVDTNGDGWGVEYTLAPVVVVNAPMPNTTHRGSLRHEYGIDHLCLQRGCYSFEVPRGSHPNDIMFILCGTIGAGSTNGVLCITDGGCVYHTGDASGVDYYNLAPAALTDDDFIGTSDGDSPTPRPTTASTVMPTSRPTASTVVYVAVELDLILRFAANTTLSHIHQFKTVFGFALRHVLMLDHIPISSLTFSSVSVTNEPDWTMWSQHLQGDKYHSAKHMNFGKLLHSQNRQRLTLDETCFTYRYTLQAPCTLVAGEDAGDAIQEVQKRVSGSLESSTMSSNNPSVLQQAVSQMKQYSGDRDGRSVSVEEASVNPSTGSIATETSGSVAGDDSTEQEFLSIQWLDLLDGANAVNSTVLGGHVTWADWFSVEKHRRFLYSVVGLVLLCLFGGVVYYKDVVDDARSAHALLSASQETTPDSSFRRGSRSKREEDGLEMSVSGGHAALRNMNIHNPMASSATNTSHHHQPIVAGGGSKNMTVNGFHIGKMKSNTMTKITPVTEGNTSTTRIIADTWTTLSSAAKPGEAGLGHYAALSNLSEEDEGVV